MYESLLVEKRSENTNNRCHGNEQSKWKEIHIKSNIIHGPSIALASSSASFSTAASSSFFSFWGFILRRRCCRLFWFSFSLAAAFFVFSAAFQSANKRERKGKKKHYNMKAVSLHRLVHAHFKLGRRENCRLGLATNWLAKYKRADEIHA